jgi:DNA repair exonuclease SbcCD ATPase subunit
MISGHNGAGKSNVLEALSYGLFGKPLKKVTLGGLINTTNRKNLLVTVEFDVGGVEYKVIRGQKPAVLEFYANDELVDQNAASKDYQAKIEYILGMDHKMFTQVVVLNKEKYVPFLELSTGDRRKIVEDILDIAVFSVMSDNLKNEIRSMGVAVQDATYEFEKTKRSVEATQRLIAESSGAVQEQIDEAQVEHDQLSLDMESIRANIEKLNGSLPDMAALNANLNSAKDKIRQFEGLMIKSETRLGDHIKASAFYLDNDNCPTCNHPIDAELKQAKTHECETKKTEVSQLVEKIKEQRDLCQEQAKKLANELSLANLVVSEINGLKSKLAMCESQQNALLRKIVSLEEKKKVSSYQGELDTHLLTMDRQHQTLQVLLQEQETLNKCKDLLKDDAIKASVVREYIDFINGRVNEYLNTMEFFINIRLDENFNDKIEAVNKEGFTYDNLSTGQKCRVSLAIWLALLEVASLKNSIVTNVLILDEILEPMDQQGVALFMKLVNEKLPNKNTFVVTQRADEFVDYFRSELKFCLKEGFTELV